MKRSMKSLFVLLVLVISTSIYPKQTAAQQGNFNFQVFYDELSPYGQWVDYKNYGYVWLPDEGPNFVPYSTRGHWILTDYGWTWVSGYEWGWAPFHYGRWDYDNYYGWLWVPDNQWGPSWVNWRRADGYYGWSPMEPGISINLSFGRPYNRDHDHWMFVRDRDFERPEINRYYVNRTDHDRIIRNSTVIRTTYNDNSRHTTYVTGPARDDVQRVTGRRINPVSIRENNRPGQQLKNGQLEIYRPQVNKNNDRGSKVAPSRISNLKDVKRPSERKARDQQSTGTPSNNIGRQQQQERQNDARQQNIKAQSGQQQQERQDAAKQQNNSQQQRQQQQQQQNAVRQQNNAQQQQQLQQNSAAQQRQQQQQQNAARQQNNAQQQRQQQPQQRQQQQQQQRQEPQQNTATPQREQPRESNSERGKRRND